MLGKRSSLRWHGLIVEDLPNHKQPKCGKRCADEEKHRLGVGKRRIPLCVWSGELWRQIGCCAVLWPG